FIRLLPRCNQRVLNLIGQSSTLHALIAGAHDMPALRVFASCLSMFAFTGLVVFEIVWGTAVLRTVLGGSMLLYHFTMVVFALYLVGILWTGGQRAAITAAQYQLVIAYIGLHILTAWALTTAGDKILTIDAPV